MSKSKIMAEAANLPKLELPRNGDTRDMGQNSNPGGTGGMAITLYG